MIKPLSQRKLEKHASAVKSEKSILAINKVKKAIGRSSSQERSAVDPLSRGGMTGREGGGIPRPNVTSSPSKLAIRTNTKLLGSKQDQVGRSFSGDHRSQPSEQGLRYPVGGQGPTPGAQQGYQKGLQKTLVSDKLYPRISSEQPNYHPSSPQRSHTLSMIPSHTSRTKLGSAAVKTTFSSSTSSSVQYTQSSSSSTQSTQSTGSSTQSTQSNGSSAQSGSSVRFNTESTSTSTGRGTLAVQYNNNQPGNSIKGIMKADVTQYPPSSSSTTRPNPYSSTSNPYPPGSTSYPSSSAPYPSSSSSSYPSYQSTQTQQLNIPSSLPSLPQGQLGQQNIPSSFPYNPSYANQAHSMQIHPNQGQTVGPPSNQQNGSHSGPVNHNRGQSNLSNGHEAVNGHGPTNSQGFGHNNAGHGSYLGISSVKIGNPQNIGQNSQNFGQNPPNIGQNPQHPQKGFSSQYTDGSKSQHQYPGYKGPGPGLSRNFPHLLHSSHPSQPTPPPYTQPPPPTPSSFDVAPLQLDGEDLNSLNHSDLCRRLISVKGDLKKLSQENGNIVADLNKKLQDQINEIRNLKELNQRLTEDSQELRDLCCFLDDDRQKGRKLAREWQRFGRYTASVMRQEVSNYQTKLRDLDGKQQALVKDNIELKELCLYLDEERGNVSVCIECGGPSSHTIPSSLPSPHPPLLPSRDEGDGSSSSTNNDDSEISSSNLADELNAVRVREALYNKEFKIGKSGLNDEVLQYIRDLEDRLGVTDLYRDDQLGSKNHYRGDHLNSKDHYQEDHRRDIENPSPQWNSRPEAVSNAFKVLSIQERILERSLDSENTDTELELGEGEKALVREMCNVVWKKLEEN